MPLKPLSRRTLLRGGAGVVIALPLLDAMLGRAGAQAFMPPPRFVLAYMGTCTGSPALTNPAAVGPFTGPLPASWAALQPIAQHISILSGLSYPLYNAGSTPPGPGAALIQQHGGTMSPAVSGVTAQDAVAPNVRGHSADQVAADLIGAGTPIPSLQLRVQAAAYNNNTGARAQGRGISIRRNGTILSELLPNESPLRLFNQLFSTMPFDGPRDAGVGAGGGMAGGSATGAGGGALGGGTAGGSRDAGTTRVPTLLERRKSVLDVVLGDANTLSSKVGAEDRQRIDQHFTHIRELEQSLAGGAAGPGGGSPGAGGGSGSMGGGTGGGSAAGGGRAGGAAGTGGGSAVGGGRAGGSAGGAPSNACVGLSNPGADPAVSYGFGSWSNETLRGQQMADMMAYAMACDLTRVASWMLTHDQCWLNSAQTAGSTFPGQGGPPDIHNDSHFATPDIRAANCNWGAGLFGRLVSNLAGRMEAGGTVLDRTFLSLVFAEGTGAHNKTSLTFLVAGSPSRIRNGVHLATNGAHPAQVQIAGLNAIGGGTTLGEVTGALPGLRLP